VSEDTPVGEVLPILRFALAAERQTERFACPGGRGVVLRFGLLDGPGTGNARPIRDFGATLHVSDAGRALLSALSLPSGSYSAGPGRSPCGGQPPPRPLLNTQAKGTR
jgi:hypothetical protein